MHNGALLGSMIDQQVIELRARDCQVTALS
jgi:hypothetical protein